MTKEQVLTIIKAEFDRLGFCYSISDSEIYFTLINRVNSDLEATIYIEALDNNMFSILFNLPNIRKLHRAELAKYVFSYTINYSAVAVTENLEKAVIKDLIAIEDIDILENIIAYTMLKVAPFIIGW